MKSVYYIIRFRWRRWIYPTTSYNRSLLSFTKGSVESTGVKPVSSSLINRKKNGQEETIKPKNSNKAAGSSDAHKQNCVWLFVSHQKCTCDDLMSGLSRSCGDAMLKFEPFVLHVQCRRLEDAQLLHSVAVNSGFRNSGLTVGKTGKIISAVRSTHGLEVPLSHHGKLLVDEDYIQFLTQIANQKMEENVRRIQRFFQNLQSAVSAERQQIPDSPGTQEHQDSQHTHKKGRRREQGTNQQNQLNVYKRRQQHKTDGCHGNGDSSLPELDDCLDLFTETDTLFRKVQD
ncbi:tRNA wybutosine-synthesizing protein 3 homolog isoform X1 [Poeciliopsis prolifica]|uniref:tRNA wybutosine-synthesizing protein 3 homolog isoform X1 n=1 Tax=Poeciliopsis prolifica TaxID=188132 RepID=UPI00241361E8|nr:tRNA wybutosine-synthesizing protein 3 homolog isoform X1 [Poeciliopsis prolifica]